jgi:hypothetical protein
MTLSPLRVLGPFLAAGALTVTLLPLGTASAQTTSSGAASVSVEPASKKKKGPPPGATTQQIQGWVQEKLTEFHPTCKPSGIYPCDLTFKWSKLRWMGTARVCIEGVFGQPCLKYGTAYVARVDVLVTSTTAAYDNFGTMMPEEKALTQYGYWDGGRKRITYQPWAGGPTWTAGCELDCGKDLVVRKDEFGRWYFGFGVATYYLR